MVREDGKWKFCGQPISRSFASSDLCQFVIQANEVSFPINKCSIKTDLSHIFGALPGDLVPQMAPYGPQAGAFVDYFQNNLNLDSTAVLFKNSADAGRALPAWYNLTKQRGPGGLKDLGSIGLGDESLVVSL